MHTAFLKMRNSIINQDSYILFAAIITFIVLLLVILCFHVINSNERKMYNNPDWAELLRNLLNFFYALFTTLITLFPLLGMFGTVAALLSLDFSATDEGMESIKNNFFNALTSTAWGITFAMIYKIVNACIISKVNDTIEQIQVIVNKNKKNSRSTKGDPNV